MDMNDFDLGSGVYAPNPTAAESTQADPGGMEWAPPHGPALRLPRLLAIAGLVLEVLLLAVFHEALFERVLWPILLVLANVWGLLFILLLVVILIPGKKRWLKRILRSH